MSPPDRPKLTELQRHAHDAADASGDAGYLDPASGLFVMTRSALERRGHCCRLGCRHCPWDHQGPSAPINTRR